MRCFLVIVAISVLILLGTSPGAAAGIAWSGSLETGPEYYSGSGTTTFDGTFRLKLDLSSGAPQSGVVLLQYQAETPAANAADGVNELQVNQAYLDLALPANAILRIGRQKIAWGSGYAWNPTNYLGTAKNRADLTDELPGVDAINFDRPFGQSTVTLAVKPQPTLNEWSKAVKLATRAGRSDLAFSLYQQGEANGYGLDWATTLGEFTVYTEIASKTGSGLFYIGDGGVLSTRSSSSRYLHGLVGINRMFPNDWMIQAEYYYNQEGWCPAERQNYTAYIAAPANQGQLANLAAQTAERFGDLSRNYLFLLVRKAEIIDDLAVTVSVLGNLDDGSTMITPTLEYRLGENTTANLTVSCYSGTAVSECGSLPDRVQITAKVKMGF